MTTAVLRPNLSRYLLFASLVCFALTTFFLWQRYTPVTLSFTNFPQSLNSYSLSGIAAPASLSIPDLGINLPVFAGMVKDGRWPVTPKGLIHLSDTPHPGEIGNSVIYGHNWPNLLGPLKKAQVGQVIEVTTGSGAVAKFVIQMVSTVAPYQTDLLAPSETPILTLYTCTGFLDTQRLVITATSL